MFVLTVLSPRDMINEDFITTRVIDCRLSVTVNRSDHSYWLRGYVHVQTGPVSGSVSRISHISLSCGNNNFRAPAKLRTPVGY